MFTNYPNVLFVSLQQNDGNEVQTNGKLGSLRRAVSSMFQHDLEIRSF